MPVRAGLQGAAAQEPDERLAVRELAMISSVPSSESSSTTTMRSFPAIGSSDEALQTLPNVKRFVVVGTITSTATLARRRLIWNERSQGGALVQRPQTGAISQRQQRCGEKQLHGLTRRCLRLGRHKACNASNLIGVPSFAARCCSTDELRRERRNGLSSPAAGADSTAGRHVLRCPVYLREIPAMTQRRGRQLQDRTAHRSAAAAGPFQAFVGDWTGGGQVIGSNGFVSASDAGELRSVATRRGSVPDDRLRQPQLPHRHPELCPGFRTQRSGHRGRRREHLRRGDPEHSRAAGSWAPSSARAFRPGCRSARTAAARPSPSNRAPAATSRTCASNSSGGDDASKPGSADLTPSPSLPKARRGRSCRPSTGTLSACPSFALVTLGPDNADDGSQAVQLTPVCRRPSSRRRRS